MRLTRIAMLLAMTLFSGTAFAQEQRGSIEGVVKDASGAVLPGVTVTATAASGAKLEAVTDAEGVFRFPSVAPTTYTVAANLTGFSPREISNVQVSLGQARRVEFSLAVAGVAETVQVTARTSGVDLTTPATGTNISRERIELIPRGRDFTDVIGQAAGAAPESQAGGISVNGSSGSENRFIIDGIDTTSPQVGTSAVPMRADFMEEVQVKSAGYAAEFGGSTGGVVNAITRSGTNRFSGSVQSEFQQRSWGGKQRPILVDSLTSSTFEYINPDEDDETRIDPGFSIGGPILRDRLWFFGAYMPGIRDTQRTVTFSNGVTNTFDQDFRVNYGTFNVTGNAGSKLLFRGGGNFSPHETERDLPSMTGRTSLTNPNQYLRGTKGERNTYSGSVDYIATSNLTIAARAGRFLTDSQSTGVTFPGSIVQINSTSTPAGLAALPPNVPRTSGNRQTCSSAMRQRGMNTPATTSAWTPPICSTPAASTRSAAVTRPSGLPTTRRRATTPTASSTTPVCPTRCPRPVKRSAAPTASSGCSTSRRSARWRAATTRCSSRTRGRYGRT